MIGIFDSGIGGLTVARAIEKQLPNHSLLYYGDTARTPYGTKSADVIIDYSLQNGEFLLENGAKVIVIGCNSASSVATDKLRAEFNVPVLEVIGPAAKQATAITANGRIGVIGTRATIRSGIYEKEVAAIQPEYSVISVACPLLVPLVEEGWLDHRETKMILRKYLHPLKQKNIDTLILGCTHYPLLKDLITVRSGRNVTIIDSSVEVAKALQDIVDGSAELQRLATETQHQFFFSDLTEAAQNTALKIFGRPVELKTP